MLFQEQARRHWTYLPGAANTANAVLYRLGRALVALFASTQLEMDVELRGQMPAGPKILVANHPTTVDPFLMLTWTAEPVSILVTGQVFKIPVLGRYLSAAGHIPVVQGRGRAAFEGARQRLRAGRNVGIFPEGTLSPLSPGIGFSEPRTGAARLALSTGAPVVPIGISLQVECIRYIDGQIDAEAGTARFYSGGPYAVTVGDPIVLSGDVNDREDVQRTSHEILEQIRRLSEESRSRIPTSRVRVGPALRRRFDRPFSGWVEGEL